MRHGLADIKNSRGSAGKGFLIFLATIILLAAAGYILWKPLLLPLVGEAVAQRAEEPVTVKVPKESPQITVVVPEGWVYQRGFFTPSSALVQTPDLKMKIEMSTWEPGSGPSFEAGLQEALNTLQTDGATLETSKKETLRDGLMLFYTSFESGDQKTLIGLIGTETEKGKKSKASALLDISVTGAELETYLPSLSEFLNGVEITS